MAVSRLEALAGKIRASGIPTHFEADQSRLLIEIWRLVAEGKPVPAGQVAQTAARLNMQPEAAVAFIDQMSERDESGNIVGIFGLSQKQHPHNFIVDGRTFYTWCAWDALFLPPMLKQPARIESICPQTQQGIRISLTPTKVQSCEPAGITLSIIVPDTSSEGISCVEEVWSAFCCNVRFFASETAARTWFSGKKQDVIFLTVDEGFRLGLLAFKELLAYV